MTSLYVKLIVQAIMNFPGSHGYSIIKNFLALPISERGNDYTLYRPKTCTRAHYCAYT